MQPITLPAPPSPTTDRQFFRMAAAERHAAKGHREAQRIRGEHAELAERAEDSGKEVAEGEDGHVQHLTAAATHDQAAQAHEQLAEVYDRGDAVDPRARRKAEQGAGRAKILPATCAKCPGEVTDPTVTTCSTCKGPLTVTDNALETERHGWLLRHGSRPTFVDLHVKGEPPIEIGLDTCRCPVCSSKNNLAKLKMEAAKRGGRPS